MPTSERKPTVKPQPPDATIDAKALSALLKVDPTAVDRREREAAEKRKRKADPNKRARS